MNSRLAPAESFLVDLGALEDIEVQVLHSRLQRQIDHEFAHESETSPETEFRHAELLEELNRREVQASIWRPLFQSLAK